MFDSWDALPSCLRLALSQYHIVVFLSSYFLVIFRMETLCVLVAALVYPAPCVYAKLQDL